MKTYTHTGYPRGIIEQKFYANKKTVTARFSAPYYAKASVVCEKAQRAVLRAINTIVDDGKQPTNVKVSITLTGNNDDLIDFGRYGPVLSQVRLALEKAGLSITSFSYRFKRAKDDEWIFDISFYEVEKAVNDKQWKLYRR